MRSGDERDYRRYHRAAYMDFEIKEPPGSWERPPAGERAEKFMIETKAVQVRLKFLYSAAAERE
jgi:hypothetical protein